MMEKFIALSLKGNKQTTKGQYSHPLETVPLIYIPCQLTGFYMIMMRILSLIV